MEVTPAYKSVQVELNQNRVLVISKFKPAFIDKCAIDLFDSIEEKYINNEISSAQRKTLLKDLKSVNSQEGYYNVYFGPERESLMNNLFLERAFRPKQALASPDKPSIRPHDKDYYLASNSNLSGSADANKRLTKAAAKIANTPQISRNLETIREEEKTTLHYSKEFKGKMVEFEKIYYKDPEKKYKALESMYKYYENKNVLGQKNKVREDIIGDYISFFQRNGIDETNFRETFPSDSFKGDNIKAYGFFEDLVATNLRTDN